MAECSIAVFDLGGVLIDWNPRYLYRELFDGDTEAMEEFLATVCTQSWNEQQDAGRPFAEACASLKLVHPHKAQLIDAWVRRYDEMLAGPISGTLDILMKLNSLRVPLYALSNWSVETFPAALKRFEFLKWFRGVMLSGEVKLLKPDPRIFKLFLETFAIDPALTVYIDDRGSNVEAAMALGMHGILFTDAAALRTELIGLGLLHQHVNDPSGKGQLHHLSGMTYQELTRCFKCRAKLRRLFSNLDTAPNQTAVILPQQICL